MSIAEFFQENWGVLIQLFIAILTVIIMWCIYCNGKTDRKREEEENIKKNIPLRLEKIEHSIELLTTLYPQLKSLEKLDNFKKLNLTQADIRKIVSEVLQTTNIIPETIELKVEEKIEKKLNSFENGIAAIIAQKLNLIDKQFGKPIGNSADYLTLALVEYFKRNYLATIQYLDKAIEINPNYADAWYGNARIYYLKRDKRNALKYLTKAIELKPKYKKNVKIFENI